MGKGLHSLFKAVGNQSLQVLSILGESGSEVSYFISEPKNFMEVTRLSDDINKYCLKETMKQINNLINNQTFLVQYPEKGEPLTLGMDYYKAKNQSGGSLDKLKLRILVRGYLQNKELVGDTWSPIASMSTLKYLFADVVKYKARVHRLDFIGSFLQAKFKNRVFVKYDSRYVDYSPEYSNYFGRYLSVLNSMYDMINSGNLSPDE